MASGRVSSTLEVSVRQEACETMARSCCHRCLHRHNNYVIVTVDIVICCCCCHCCYSIVIVNTCVTGIANTPQDFMC